MHWVDDICKGKKCVLCQHVKRDVPATHSVSETRNAGLERHVAPAYICCGHFRKMVGAAAPCEAPTATRRT